MSAIVAPTKFLFVQVFSHMIAPQGRQTYFYCCLSEFLLSENPCSFLTRVSFWERLALSFSIFFLSWAPFCIVRMLFNLQAVLGAFDMCVFFLFEQYFLGLWFSYFQNNPQLTRLFLFATKTSDDVLFFCRALPKCMYSINMYKRIRLHTHIYNMYIYIYIINVYIYICIYIYVYIYIYICMYIYIYTHYLFIHRYGFF